MQSYTKQQNMMPTYDKLLTWNVSVSDSAITSLIAGVDR